MPPRWNPPYISCFSSVLTHPGIRSSLPRVGSSFPLFAVPPALAHSFFPAHFPLSISFILRLNSPPPPWTTRKWTAPRFPPPTPIPPRIPFFWIPSWRCWRCFPFLLSFCVRFFFSGLDFPHSFSPPPHLPDSIFSKTFRPPSAKRLFQAPPHFFFFSRCSALFHTTPPRFLFCKSPQFISTLDL